MFKKFTSHSFTFLLSVVIIYCALIAIIGIKSCVQTGNADRAADKAAYYKSNNLISATIIMDNRSPFDGLFSAGELVKIKKAFNDKTGEAFCFSLRSHEWYGVPTSANIDTSHIVSITENPNE